jgi:FKBP-type peptidyl-prolyl cis-trans isomerase
VLFLLAGAAACSEDTNPGQPTTSSAPYSQTDLVVGTGTQAVAGNRITVAYAGWLYDSARPEGKGATVDAAPSFPFTVGVGAVIRGWDQGVPGMRVGGQRRLIIPPELAYGSAGSPPRVPPNATLIFDITLLSVP